MRRTANSDIEIEVVGGLAGAASAIAIDYDVGQFTESEGWEPGAVIAVSRQRFTWQDPNYLIWDVSPCKADANGDWSADFDDVDPFVLLLTDPDAYVAAYPGLDDPNAVLLHGDMNCDEVIDLSDIEPFVDRISCYPSYCSPECGSCGGDGMNGDPPSPTPESVAAIFRTHLHEERYPAFVGLAEQIIAAEGDSQRGQFWTDVLTFFEGE